MGVKGQILLVMNRDIPFNHKFTDLRRDLARAGPAMSRSYSWQIFSNHHGYTGISLNWRLSFKSVVAILRQVKLAQVSSLPVVSCPLSLTLRFRQTRTLVVLCVMPETHSAQHHLFFATANRLWFPPSGWQFPFIGSCGLGSISMYVAVTWIATRFSGII